MSPVRQWTALTAAGCVAVLVAAWFLLVSPARSEAAELRAQASAQEQTNTGLRSQLATLRAEAEQLPAKEAALAAVAAKVPADAALPELVRALDALAGSTGVELVTMAPGALTSPPGSAPAVAAAPDPAAPAPDPAAPAAAVGAAWSVLPLSLEVVGGFYDLQAFVLGLEELERAVRVTGLTVAPGANPLQDASVAPPVDSGRVLRATITAEAYVATPSAPPGAPVPVTTSPGTTPPAATTAGSPS